MLRILQIKRACRSLLIAALMVAGAFCSAGIARPLEQVIESKTLRVSVYGDYAPFSWSEKGQAKGVDVDIARAVAREIGVKPHIMVRVKAGSVNQDLRYNFYRGPPSGEGVVDIMMHVPVDPEFANRFDDLAVANGYFQERVVVAIHPELTGTPLSFDIFKEKQKIGVQIGTVADYFLMRYKKGVLMENITHHVKPMVGVKEFIAKETSALMGVRSKIEGPLHQQGVKAKFVEPDMPGIFLTNWVVGIASRDDTRKLTVAIQAALDKIRASGEMEKIYANYGITYTPPPAP